ncbi:WD40-repeat-containing domain protein [Suillus paluster]|uniref:WD40-repeat-containing domain protein n=1 Tax=Suillus paluster TaxID=48578 RepID=UPI001B863B7B|nr:WD40-repeat-containing domain protein [Suillus paluster]KAG1723083.1 WD40-repeat-containing domain protein [Suillus paluster]
MVSSMDSLFVKVQHTSLPKSLRPTSPPPDNVPKHKHIKDLKLRTKLNRQAVHVARSKALVEDAELLLASEAGKMQVENELERTWRIGAGQEAAKGRRELKLDGGPYRSRYSRNGRHLAIVGSMGHVATFDWQTGTMHAELQLQETCRDITFLQDQSFFAVAQKKYVFIYDRDGVELHRLKAHIEPTRLEFLPYHWLLASVSIVGKYWISKISRYSTGHIVAEHRTKLGACNTLAQNKHNAVLHLGHSNGVVSLWTPNLPHPAVQILAHLDPVVGLSVDQSSVGDGVVKVWDCRNWKGTVREWTTRGGAQARMECKGALGVAVGGSVNVAPPPLYLTHPQYHIGPLTSVRFCPFQDILTMDTMPVLSSILVPGHGSRSIREQKGRREREVKGLVGQRGNETKLVDDDDEDASEGERGQDDKKKTGQVTSGEKRSGKCAARARVSKRYLRKQRQERHDPTAAIEKGQMEARQPSALDRFRRP